MTNGPDAPQIFNAHVESYDAARRRLIPPFESFYGTAVQALRLAATPPQRILDLGAGTGLLARRLRAAYPDSHITLLDGAGLMLEKARDLLGEENLSYVQRDLSADLPEGPWDAVTSALAIHHLSDDEKRALFSRIRRILRPGGVFVNAEQVAGPTPLFSDLYAVWHESQARAAGSSDEEWAGSVQRMSFDRCASVEDQLRWLRDAGFGQVDCLFKDHRFAVVVAL